MKTLNILGYDVFIESLDKIKLKDKIIINTINPHSYVVAKNDNFFKKALKNSDVLIPDGSGIVLAANFLYGEKIKKIAGADLHEFLLQKINNENGKVFYLGSSQNTLNKIKERIKNEYPNILVETFSPPYKPEFNEEENLEMITKINSFKPDVLFVGMTAPKQEKWLEANKDKLNFKIAACIGAVFDFYAGTVKRPSQFWINMHLEWLPRFLKEPKRLWRRNFISTPIFIKDTLLAKINL
ncbi:WecB/TagA/CpsF family glycosyltransferase [Caminibacter mediatlanticus TB-2]|uniref:WecB/TagA/CpsF family glycosyltransferase n=1 Tax=Caminibacter mediatlanticus TB-2 TaxID=391592 RepID=A0ABX5V6R8_9BACT|nr:WecB/TagA/CpsF family glycosyltransferase [Caminibacter mediatlanticus]QCT93965.1 WecB/TagA/CpsF family glycosyltransferase [Caminibacter mediatlanticus TB-2]